MILRNREGIKTLDIRPDWHADRHDGLSALVRLRDEATWCELALRSFVDWCDEIVVVVQPSVDDTHKVVARLAEEYDPAFFKVFNYPYQTWPSGPGHDQCPADSVEASAYHYNFTLAQSTRTHAVKLDGDLVMMDWAGARIRALMAGGHDRIKFHGTDIVGDDLAHTGNHPHCPTDGVFKVEPGVHYAQGPLSQKLVCERPVTAALDDPAFLHFKWSRKPLASATKGWPKDWRSKDHFKRIFERRKAVAAYRGEYPTSVRALLP